MGTTGWWASTEDPEVSRGLFLGITIVPDLVASCTFVIAGWLQVCNPCNLSCAAHCRTPTPHPRLLEVVEASHSWLGGFHPARIGWWAGVMNTLGAIGFLVNAVLWYRVQSTVATTIALLVGSVFFFVGSYIAWLEQCLD